MTAASTKEYNVIFDQLKATANQITKFAEKSYGDDAAKSFTAGYMHSIFTGVIASLPKAQRQRIMIELQRTESFYLGKCDQ